MNDFIEYNGKAYRLSMQERVIFTKLLYARIPSDTSVQRLSQNPMVNSVTAVISHLRAKGIDIERRVFVYQGKDRKQHRYNYYVLR